MATEQEQKPPIPIWAWGFAIACIAIPIITVGGAIPGAIGGGGAAGCVSVARDDTKALGTRLFLCGGITALCWGLFGVMIYMATN